MNKFKHTFWFYTKEHFQKKSLIWLGICLIAPIGIFFAIDHFGGGSRDAVAIVQESAEFVVPSEAFADIERTDFHFVDDVTARAMLEEGEVDDVFIIAGVDRPELRIESNQLNGHFEVQVILEQWLTMMHIEEMMLSYDLPDAVVAELVTPIEIEMEVADMEDLIAVEVVNFVLPYGVFMLVLMSGQMVANSVASEKTSRVMEVMLGKVHPTFTMISKVLSSMVGILLPIISILLGVGISHIIGVVDLGTVLELVDEFFSVNALILTLVVLILGYFCFIFLFAAAGAIANSVESLTSTLQPVTYLIMIPFFLTMFVDIDGVLMNFLVYVPFISPYVIVQRYLLGASGMIEVFIALALMAAFSLFMLVISARLYMNGISHTSEKISFSDFKKLLQK